MGKKSQPTCIWPSRSIQFSCNISSDVVLAQVHFQFTITLTGEKNKDGKFVIAEITLPQKLIDEDRIFCPKQKCGSVLVRLKLELEMLRKTCLSKKESFFSKDKQIHLLWSTAWTWREYSTKVAWGYGESREDSHLLSEAFWASVEFR